METNVNQKFYRAPMASLFSVSLATAFLCGAADLGLAQSAKKITPDPYFSTLHQTPAAQAPSTSEPSSFYQPAWEPPKTETKSTPARQAKIEKANSEAEVWSSVARKTTKPVTRIDFSRLNAQPPKKADVSLPAAAAAPLKPVATAAAVINAAPQKKFQALTPILPNQNKTNSTTAEPPKSAEEIIKTAMAQSRSIIRQKNEASEKHSLVAANAPAAITPAADALPPLKAKPLNPAKNPSDFNLPKIANPFHSPLPTVTQASATGEEGDAGVNAASRIAAAAEDGSFVQQAAYQPQLGERLKQMVEKGVAAPQQAAPDSDGRGPVSRAISGLGKRKTSGSGTRGAVAENVSGSATRVADASSSYYDPRTVPTPQGVIESQPLGSEVVSQETFYEGSTYQGPAAVEQTYPPQEYQQEVYQGESFENSRVLALVGGHPVFVGDMAFEVNQILEKHMKGAPQELKDAQKGRLMERLLPKYVDQKILFVSTLDQLPEEANIEDILKQAEKTFNEKVLLDLMENSNVDSVTKFDAILRSQGTSVRQMRRAWAKDQISKFFLQEKVEFNRNVTHLEMLDEYRSHYDDYAVKGKVRWEQIEIQPAKAGGRFAAKDKAEDIYNRLVHGGNFEAIAKKESHGFRAFKGGQYDWTGQGSLVNKELDKAIFTLPQGKLSGVIETKSGFHIVRVIERVEAHHTPFTEAQIGIKEKLLEARRDKAFRTYIDGLKDKINVEYVNQ